MSIIWLVGTTDVWLEEFSEVLSGFFGVRRVASLLSFGRLLGLGDIPRRESYICLVYLNQKDDLMAIHSSFSRFLKEYSRNHLCVIGHLSEDQKKVVESFNIASLGLPEDMVQAAKLLRKLTAPKPPKPTQSLGDDCIRIGDIEVDRGAACMRVTATGVEEALTPKEIRIIQVLSMAVNQPISREELVRKVWSGTHVSASTVDSHMSRLRKKLIKVLSADLRRSMAADGFCRSRPNCREVMRLL